MAKKHSVTVKIDSDTFQQLILAVDHSLLGRNTANLAREWVISTGNKLIRSGAEIYLLSTNEDIVFSEEGDRNVPSTKIS